MIVRLRLRGVEISYGNRREVVGHVLQLHASRYEKTKLVGAMRP